MPNTFMPINPGTDSAQAMNQINRNFQKLDQEAVTKVFRADNNTQFLVGKTSDTELGTKVNVGDNPVFASGKLPDNLGYGVVLYDQSGNPVIYMAVDSNGTPTLKVAEAGQNATTAGNDDLIFNSGVKVLNYIQSDSHTVVHPTLTGETIDSIPRTDGLSYIPAYLGYTSYDGGLSYEALPIFQVTPTVGSMTVTRSVTMSVDADNIYFSVKTPTDNIVPITRTIKYYLLQEPAL